MDLFRLLDHKAAIVFKRRMLCERNSNQLNHK